ncbi:MAG TPA: vitamin K epoxide reductase family protein [Candidatus Saccharimonadales bacterium]|nr:vitamin K epoxide reductase family protein [Candidatus Saccharimonadales bacterium]
MKALSSLTLKRVLPWLLIICGTIGLIAAFIITFEKIELLKDPNFVPSCNLNPIISCGSVMGSEQSNAFGFPNPLIGLMAFPVVITTGVVMLMGVSLKRWYMLGLQLGTVLGLAFIHWLFFQSTYRIGALCPYCIAVWIMTITLFWYVLLYNIEAKHVVLKGKAAQLGTFLRRHHLDILLVWLLILVALILKRFWYYFGPALGL